jgi:hypothetical protein
LEQPPSLRFSCAGYCSVALGKPRLASRAAWISSGVALSRSSGLVTHLALLVQKRQGSVGVFQAINDLLRGGSAHVDQEQADFGRTQLGGCFLLWKRMKRRNPSAQRCAGSGRPKARKKSVKST